MIDNILANVTRVVYRIMMSAYGQGTQAQKVPFHNEALTIEAYDEVLDFFYKGIGYSINTKCNYTKNYRHFLEYLRMDMDLQLGVNNALEYRRIEVLLKHIAVVLSGLDSRVNKQHKIEKNNKKLPPTLPAVIEVITVSKEKFNTIMENIKRAKENAGKILNKTDVAFLNRHMTAYICLAQG
ncbi:hypothetical protein DPMN_112011 [Dreissena polymorpha]|uniref:Uncharacterized protein n=1 Tax=Dreissena polymorpha TaxID=45954 RepID=A0A9D4KG10_DREPO|nr:hypothetical protein DPMN_112011 [Dreissena polymorpha]